jgi:hypothetical protein
MIGLAPSGFLKTDIDFVGKGLAVRLIVLISGFHLSCLFLAKG